MIVVFAGCVADGDVSGDDVGVPVPDIAVEDAPVSLQADDSASEARVAPLIAVPALCRNSLRDMPLWLFCRPGFILFTLWYQVLKLLFQRLKDLAPVRDGANPLFRLQISIIHGRNKITQFIGIAELNIQQPTLNIRLVVQRGGFTYDLLV